MKPSKGDRTLPTVVFLTGLIAIGCAGLAGAKAYFAPKGEMTRKADLIAVVEVTKVVELFPEKQCELQEATATLVSLVKGSSDEAIVFRIPCFFPCAITKVKPGKYLVFLVAKGGILQGANWQLSYRPISQGKVEWFQGETRQPLKYRPLEEAVAEVRGLLGM